MTEQKGLPDKFKSFRKALNFFMPGFSRLLFQNHERFCFDFFRNCCVFCRSSACYIDKFCVAGSSVFYRIFGITCIEIHKEISCRVFCNAVG